MRKIKMPLHKGSNRKVISENIHEMVAAGHSLKQAVAASLHNAASKYWKGGNVEYADGGEVGDDDNEKLMDHCALECMHAVETKDVSGFREALQCLIADVLNKMSSDEDGEQE